MFYCGTNNSIVGHLIVINNKPKIKNVWSTTDDHHKKYNAKYQGSLLRLVHGDQIKVKVVSENTLYCMDSRASFFGAFLLYPSDVG
jgi:hypothetical protein